MSLHALKKFFTLAGLDPAQLHRRLGCWSLARAAEEQGLSSKIERLKEVVPDISNQESADAADHDEYQELKRRLLQSYQVQVMGNILKMFGEDVNIVDIGDSAGTHCLYFREFFKGSHKVRTLSVNLDPRAIERIKARGLDAVLKRAEDVGMDDIGGDVDVFTSFEMVEHLHNPALFFHRLALSDMGKRMFITVPFVRQSRVGLHHIRHNLKGKVYAEDAHIFELSPSDWALLFKHSGWKIVEQGICRQYPRKIPIVSQFLRWYWKMVDYEGFWGAVLEKDRTWADQYQDWEE